MRALTICQPYAYLITLPREHPNHKRTENRGWVTKYRGPLAIHAGKSKDWLDTDDPVDEKLLSFGAIVATCDLIDIVAWSPRAKGTPHLLNTIVLMKYPWIGTHKHAEGPFLWILDNVKALEKPVPCNGQMGLWEWKGTA